MTLRTLPRVTALRQSDTHRLIPSRHAEPESVLGQIADADAHLAELFEIDTATNDRIAAEHGNEQLRNPRQTHSGKPLVMRLMRDDIVAVTIDGERQLMRLCKFGSSGEMSFIGLTEANADARVRAGDIKYLSKSPGALGDLNAVNVTVSPAGRAKTHRFTR